MNLDAILSAIDSEISRLQQARAVLADVPSTGAAKKGPGRPKKLAAPAPAAKKRTMSAEGRIRIAAAQKKRWAAAKKAK